MPETVQQSSDRSVSIGGNVSNTVIQTGDRNFASVHAQRAVFPSPEHVDMQAELAALREALARLESPEQRKIANALSDVEDELARPEPDKNEVGKALERTLEYASKAKGFAEALGTLQPHVTNAVAWLGEHWHKLLALVGLAE
ncbi:MAG: hypothetical protein AB7N91_06475 [Candidatus Tectimicrobiota bacterium]